MRGSGDPALPSAVSELLMVAACLAARPSEPDLRMRSEPARSTHSSVRRERSRRRGGGDGGGDDDGGDGGDDDGGGGGGGGCDDGGGSSREATWSVTMQWDREERSLS